MQTTRLCSVCGSKESLDTPLFRCSGCQADETLYCGSKCQAQDWKAHKSLCKQRRSEAQFKDQNVSSNASSMSPQPSGSDKVKAVHLKGGWNKPFNAEDAEIPNDHELFAVKGLTKRISPISQLVGVPIIIWRIRKDNPMSHLYSQEREHLDNSSVTWLMIDPWTGWAPPQWQQGIGPVIVARADKKPLSREALELIWMFCDESGEQAAEGYLNRAQLEARYKSAAFQKWCIDYKKSHKELGRLQNLSLPL